MQEAKHRRLGEIQWNFLVFIEHFVWKIEKNESEEKKE